MKYKLTFWRLKWQQREDPSYRIGINRSIDVSEFKVSKIRFTRTEGKGAFGE